MVTPLPYCTLSEVQAEIRNYDANINDKLVSAIERATAYIDEYCRKPISLLTGCRSLSACRPPALPENPYCFRSRSGNC